MEMVRYVVTIWMAMRMVMMMIILMVIKSFWYRDIMKKHN